jgi:hypothetical protein
MAMILAKKVSQAFDDMTNPPCAEMTQHFSQESSEDASLTYLKMKKY